MGYETRIDLYKIQIRRDAIPTVAEAIRSVADGAVEPHWMVQHLKLNDDGSVLWNEWPEGKWKSHEKFVQWLAIHCECGFVAFWSCEGDGTAWAYEFDGQGGYSECSARRVAALKAAATRRTRVIERDYVPSSPST